MSGLSTSITYNRLLDKMLLLYKSCSRLPSFGILLNFCLNDLHDFKSTRLQGKQGYKVNLIAGRSYLACRKQRLSMSPPSCFLNCCCLRFAKVNSASDRIPIYSWKPLEVRERDDCCSSLQPMLLQGTQEFSPSFPDVNLCFAVFSHVDPILPMRRRFGDNGTSFCFVTHQDTRYFYWSKMCAGMQSSLPGVFSSIFWEYRLIAVAPTSFLDCDLVGLIPVSYRTGLLN